VSGGARRYIRAGASAVILGALALLFWQRMRDAPRDSAHGDARPDPPRQAQPPQAALIGDRILSRYADPARRPEDDLTDLAHALGNFALLVKGDNPLPLGANEDIANALRGRNRAQLRFLPDAHRAFNAQGQLVDRWGTPLYFHAASRDRLEIRSAGPDRIMWTNDDLHRMHDGRFLKGDDLAAPSLFDAPKKKQ